jgi:NTP pyrophosphatase (non-canonical NTP hydrolase)
VAARGTPSRPTSRSPPYLLEESYELLEAIELDDLAHLREELGDVLLQVAFHSRLAEERSGTERFTVDDVAADLVAKLIRRHPHVFAGREVAGAADLAANWEAIKAAEKRRESVADGVPLGQPALALAAKLQRRAQKGRPRGHPADRRRPWRAAVRVGRRGGGGRGGSRVGVAGHLAGLSGRRPCRREHARGGRLSRGSCRVRTAHGRHPEQRGAGQHGGEQEAGLAAVVHVRPEQAEDRRRDEQPGVGAELPGQRDVGADDAVGSLRVDALAVDVAARWPRPAPAGLPDVRAVDVEGDDPIARRTAVHQRLLAGPRVSNTGSQCTEIHQVWPASSTSSQARRVIPNRERAYETGIDVAGRRSAMRRRATWTALSASTPRMSSADSTIPKVRSATLVVVSSPVTKTLVGSLGW